MTDSVKPGNGKIAFIVSPIGSKLDPTGTIGRLRYEEAIQMWEEVFSPACKEVGLEPIRADKVAETGELHEQIFKYLRDADVVIADLSGGNPNVMYELGLRHTRDKVTVQVGEYERLPFDVNTIKTIQFKRTEGGLIEARNSLVEMLLSSLAGNGSPVSATRIWNDAAKTDDTDLAEAVRRSSEPDEDGTEDEPGFMDMLAEGEAALTEVAEIMNDYSSEVSKIGASMTSATTEISNSDAQGKGFAGRVIVSRGLAAALKEPSEKLESIGDEILLRVQKVDLMVRYILARFEEDPSEFEQGQSLLTNLSEFVDTAAGAGASSAEFLQGIRNLRKISRDLAPASKSIERSTNRYLQSVELIVGWRSKILELGSI